MAAASTPGQDEIVQTARDLNQTEFSRQDLADQLGIKVSELKGGFKSARQAGALEKVGEDDDGKGRFRLTN